MCDNWIFEEPTITGDKIPYTFWLENVLSFELHTVVRQTNQHFISVLNRTRVGKKFYQDLSYLNMTCYKTPPNNSQLPHLFHRNSIVDEHNKRMLNFLPTHLYVFEAVDERDYEIEKIQYQIEKSSLPTILYIK